MKLTKITVIAWLGVLCFGISAMADNPAIWNFDLETYGSRDCWLSEPSFIDPGYPSYQYSWKITSTEAQVLGEWFSGPDGFNGSGTTGPLPINNMLVYHIDEPEIEANIYVSVDSSGYGDICIDDITFGQAQGYPVTGMICKGNVTITPEPMTICLLGLGGLLLRRKRRAK